MPPTVFTHVLRDDFRGLFRIFLRDDFQGTSLSKKKTQIVKQCIQYVFCHGDRIRIQSIEDIGQFLEFVIGLTKKDFLMHLINYQAGCIMPTLLLLGGH